MLHNGASISNAKRIISSFATFPPQAMWESASFRLVVFKIVPGSAFSITDLV
jgi:hypothetical protein